MVFKVLVHPAVLLAVLLASSGFAQGASPQKTTSSAKKPAEARPIMHGLVDPIQQVIILTEKEKLSDAEFKKAAAAINRVKGQISAMRHFSKDLGDDYVKITNSMLKDLQQADQAIAAKKEDNLRFIVRGILQHCAVCHMKQEAKGKDFPEFNQFLSKHEQAHLPWREKLDVMVSLRQFDEALNLMETKIKDMTITPQTLDLYNVFPRYLRVCLINKGDLQRPLKTLQDYMSQRKDSLPAYHQDELADWISNLTKYAAQKNLDSMSMKETESLLKSGLSLNEETYTNAGLVQMLLAAKQLQTLSQTRNPNRSERAKAYLDLGQIAERYGDSIWYSESHNLYESAIQEEPHSATAQEAYRKLEDLVIFQYSGSAGTLVPIETQKWLNSLKKKAF